MLRKIKTNSKNTQRDVQKLQKELATEKAAQLNQLKDDKFIIIHRCDGVESDFLNILLKLISGKKELLLFLTTIDEQSGHGKFVLQGSAEVVDRLGPVFCEILECKGNGKNGRYQGKITSIKKIGECEKLIKEHFVA